MYEKIQMPVYIIYICETLNMMYLKSSLENTIMNFLWVLIKKQAKSLLYLDTNERIDKMVTLSEDTLLIYSRWVCHCVLFQ